MPIEIEVIFDTVCPWCYIGKRRLERALEMRPEGEVRLRWRPFLLNPEMPPEGLDRQMYLVKKFGSEARVRRIYGAIAEAGETVEIDFAFERIDKTPNSVDSHRLIRFADAEGLGEPAVEATFQAFFLDGRDIGNRGVLFDIATDLGLDVGAVGEHLASDADVEAVHEENTQAHRLGINGVPAYLFGGRMVISGAQEPAVLARMIDAARAGAAPAA